MKVIKNKNIFDNIIFDSRAINFSSSGILLNFLIEYEISLIDEGKSDMGLN